MCGATCSAAGAPPKLKCQRSPSGASWPWCRPCSNPTSTVPALPTLSRPNKWPRRGERPRVAWNEDKNLFLDKEDHIWIPPSVTDLQQRVCIIALQGAAGNRRIEATTKVVRDVFAWSTLENDVNTFAPACIHFLSADGSVVPRQLGSALHTEKPKS
ncbi:hypothetical protein AaE_008577 [Aphanomyces astaci]|uniref:Integrase zinc-binding domain-containing protein n=1 Tax=Aphanomyces astaci TaxID=112090 RepID=A0A6A5A744_APHAT|nr:hypothetical protein AaE_008577 [Aphanomyces astaci]